MVRSILELMQTASGSWLRTCDASRFQVLYLGEQGEEDGVVEWALTGEHNARNAGGASATTVWREFGTGVAARRDLNTAPSEG